MSASGEPPSGKPDRAFVTLQPESLRVLVGVDLDGKSTFAIECDSRVGRYRFVMPWTSFLEFGAKVMEAIAQAIKSDRKGR